MNKLISTTMLILLSSFSIMCSNNSIDNFKFDINLYEKETNLDATALISYSDKSVTKDTYIINFWFPSCAPCAPRGRARRRCSPCAPGSRCAPGAGGRARTRGRSCGNLLCLIFLFSLIGFDGF